MFRVREKNSSNAKLSQNGSHSSEFCLFFFVSPFELLLMGPLRPIMPKDLGGAGRSFKITHKKDKHFIENASCGLSKETDTSLHFIIVYKNLTLTFTLMSKTRVIGQCHFRVLSDRHSTIIRSNVTANLPSPGT